MTNRGYRIGGQGGTNLVPASTVIERSETVEKGIIAKAPLGEVLVEAVKQRVGNERGEGA